MDNRDRQYWNILKGAAIFLMIWGHCIQYCTMDVFDFFDDWAFKTIYTFHMPVLMLVSGYLFFYSFQKRGLKELLTHRTQSMLQPIVFATVFSNILLLLPTYMLTGQAKFLNGELFKGIDYTYWFLWAVLFSSVLVGVFCKITEKPILRVALVVCGIGASWLFSMRDSLLFMYPYFAAGFFGCMYRENLLRFRRIAGPVSLLLFAVMLPFYEKQHYIYLTYLYVEQMDVLQILWVWVYRFLIGLVGSVLLMAGVDWLMHITVDKGKAAGPLKGLELLGKNSLQVYCLSVPILSGYLPHIFRKCMEPFGYNIFLKSMILYDLVFTPLLSVFFAAALLLAVNLLRKCGLHKLLFGR